MSKKVVTLLNKYGPMLSGELARKFEHEYGASNTARAKPYRAQKNRLIRYAPFRLIRIRNSFILRANICLTAILSA